MLTADLNLEISDFRFAFNIEVNVVLLL